uniref:Uncharacterized protein n=1 Tax=Avena sativa TaxID=4498 RepID=A0ACD5ZXB5_AVESA
MEPFQYAMFCLLVYMCFGGDRLGDARVMDIEALQRDLLGNFLSFQVFSFLPPLTKLVFRRRWSKLVSLRRRQEELFVPLIRARREAGAGGDCYVDSLVRLAIPEDGGRGLTDGEIVSLCSEFLSAGTDTTATALQWILANLVKNPEMQDRLRDEVSAVVDGELREEDLQGMPYLKAVVLEGLRRHPPGHYVLPHAAAEETTLDGYRVPAGTPVNFAVGDIGLDEEVWTAPLEFRPERFLPGGEGEDVDLTGSKEIKMMPFGAGRRVCPAMALALLHLEYFVANLVREFEWQEAAGEEVDLTEKLEFTVVMRRPLRARAVPLRHGWPVGSDTRRVEQFSRLEEGVAFLTLGGCTRALAGDSPSQYPLRRRSAAVSTSPPPPSPSPLRRRPAAVSASQLRRTEKAAARRSRRSILFAAVSTSLPYCIKRRTIHQAVILGILHLILSKICIQKELQCIRKDLQNLT